MSALGGAQIMRSVQYREALWAYVQRVPGRSTRRSELRTARGASSSRGLVPPAPRAPSGAFVAAQALPLTNGAAGHGGLGDADDDDALSIDSQGTL
jgi:hypothetical protein